MRGAAILSASALLALAGCGAGDPTYYRLAIWPGQASPAAALPVTVEVEAPSVASYLDRDYIVESVADYRLHLSGNDAWAEPIGDMIGRTFTADLAQRLTGDRVFAAGSSSGGNAPDARVALDIGRFDRDGKDGSAVLRGTLVIRDPAGATIHTEALDLADPATGSGSAAFTAAESRLLGQAADHAAAVLATLHPTLPIPPAG